MNKFSHRFLQAGRILLLAVSLLFHDTAHSQLPSRPDPPRLVNDLAGILTKEEVISLEKQLVAFNDTTSTQIAVVTVSSLQGYDVSDFTDRLAESWGVGRKGRDNGIMLLIKPRNDEGKGFARISVGYGLEEFVTDAVSGRIIENEMIPSFREDKYYEGIAKAVAVLIDLTSGKYKAEAYASDGPPAIFGLVFLLVILGLFFILAGRRTAYHAGNHTSIFTTLMLLNMLNSRGHSGKWGDFSSGGGWFSGGSSGSGFGGFGGGSFGGGGASGSW